ncbi:hypothetical protein H0H87_011162 [Tephrocybe sp. NHM501043]|nr:hypothetical protein H0H87_011162 [Tephrocybe sp. NHM501043]
MNNCDTFFEQIEACMNSFIAAGSFKDLKMPNVKYSIGNQVLASLAGILFEYVGDASLFYAIFVQLYCYRCLTRFKNSTAIHPILATAVRQLQVWLDSWIAGISTSPSRFDDPFKDTNQAVRDHITGFLKNKVDRLVHIVDREQAKIDGAAKRAKSVSHLSIGANLDEGILSALKLSYDGPGITSRRGVQRHDNDFVYIEDIRVAPTNEELICDMPPFLPANIYGAPHPHPDESVQRLLDIQFRLLREELTAPLRSSIQLVRQDLLKRRGEINRLNRIIKDCGGRYNGGVNPQESVIFNVYTGIEFSSIIPDRRGLSVGFSFDTPPGRARAAQAKARQNFWEGMSGKRMMQGGLIALVWKRGNEVDVHLGILASSVKEISESVRADKDRVSARVVFFDSDIELRILAMLKDPRRQRDGSAIMVESPVMFEAVRPFLDALKLVEPESIPFAQYLVHRPLGYFPGSGVHPPRYARSPGFAYQLAPLFRPESGVDDLKLYVNDPESIARARLQLRHSRLDSSQAEAVIDALTREIALIQGPPGTGKSFTGIELLRVLVKSAKPILMIAFTNHALDHLMTGVLDAGITDKLVRLGSRSADERIKKFSIEEIEQVVGRSRLDRSFAQNHWQLKKIEEEIRKLMNSFAQRNVPMTEIAQYIATQYPEHSERMQFPPTWISCIHNLSVADNEAGWQTVGSSPSDDPLEYNSVYSFWERGGDLKFLSRTDEFEVPILPASISNSLDVEPSLANRFALLQLEADPEGSNSDEDEVNEGESWQTSWLSTNDDRNRERDPMIMSAPLPEALPPSRPRSPAGLQIPDLRDPAVFFAAQGCAEVPSVPVSNRPLETLLEDGNVWSFSVVERERLHVYWKERVRETIHQNNIHDFESLRGKYTQALQLYNEGKDEARRQLLSNVDIIGCTTTGQLARVRDALSDLVAVIIDERDQVELADQEGDQVAEIIDDTRVERIKVARRIIILSLVRNAGGPEDGRPRERPAIGFLKV